MYNKQPRQRNYVTAPKRTKARTSAAGRPGVKRTSRRQAQLLIRRLITVALVAVVILLAVYGVTQIPRGQTQLHTLNFTPNDQYAPFNGGLLYLSGGQLSFVSARGAVRDMLPLGDNGSFHVSGQMIVAWRGVQLYVLNGNGDVLYNDRMDTPILFARIGASYVAALVAGADGASQLVVMTHSGTPVWTIDNGSAQMIDVGFFGSQDLRLWTLGLDVTGAAPATLLASYEPKRYEYTGGNTLYDQIVYKVFQRGSNLMLVDSSAVRAYDYRCAAVSAVLPVTVYGWQAHDIHTVAGEPVALFTPISDMAGQRAAIRSVRLIAGSGDTMVRLPAPCLDVRLGSRYVYGFTDNTVYIAQYGQSNFKAHTLSATIDRVLCLLDNNRAVVASGNETFWIDLPSQ